ncbi:MAG: glycosyltransferase family 2 protein [Deltaproteobacteria bacterium]|nr:glycosyltransferase family 2 protein [Deltaproteobacteria bacterium]
MLRILVQALALVGYVNRYIGACLLRLVRRPLDETVDDYTPTVTVVVPLYNEGAAIQETLRSVLASAYPHALLRVLCIDDCSTDDSHAQACAVARDDDRLTVIRNPHNAGKRTSINHAIRHADSEILISVDSDVIVLPDAIRELVRRFARPEIAAVGGWVDVRNKHQNWLTRMQVLKYWYAYYLGKNIERLFRRVMSVSGCLAAYRRAVLVELLPVLDERTFLGAPIRYGEDRYLTRQIVKAGHHTTITLSARCRTFVPATLGEYFSQQLRWRRANLLDYAAGCTHVWRLPPLVAINYFVLALVLIVYPIGVVRAIAAHRIVHVVMVHVGFLALFGGYYRWRVRAWPAEERVGPLAYVPHALCMPITSGLLVVLALFTLDASSWETRGPPR